MKQFLFKTIANSIALIAGLAVLGIVAGISAGLWWIYFTLITGAPLHMDPADAVGSAIGLVVTTYCVLVVAWLVGCTVIHALLPDD